jgi:RNA polymerase sigma-70 factor, ECF subfamily
MYEVEAAANLLFATAQKEAAIDDQPAAASTDESIIDAVLGGERDHFGRLYDRYAPMVHGILLARVPRDDVEDLLQEIFLQALKKLHTLRDQKAFGPWVAMIARNRAMDFHRHARETVDIKEDMAKAAENRMSEAREMLGIIRSLPEAYRETLVLRFVEGMTGPEISERTGLTPASVRVNLHRGMKILRQRLGLEEGA